MQPGQQPSEEHEVEVDLRQYFAAVWARRHLVGSLTIAAALVAGLLSVLPPPVYESEVLFQLSEQSAPVYASPVSAVNVLTSLSFLNEVLRAQGRAEPPEDVRRRVKADPIRETQMARLRVRHTDAEEASALAQAIADRFIARASETPVEKRRIIRDRLAGIDTELKNVDRLLALARQTLPQAQLRPIRPGDRGGVAELFVSAVAVGEALRQNLSAEQVELRTRLLEIPLPGVVAPPARTARPVAPRTLLNTALAGLLGFVAGVVVATLLDVLTPVILPPPLPLASIPASGRRSRSPEAPTRE